MEHLLATPRPIIDNFEQVLINAYSGVRGVEAIWIREMSGVIGEAKKFTRVVWLQLRHNSLADRRAIKALTEELLVRVGDAPFGLEVRCVVDELPPAVIAPSCIYRRGSGRV